MMKKTRLMILIFTVLAVLVSGCSSKKSGRVVDSGVYFEDYEFEGDYESGALADYAYAAEESMAYSKSVPAAAEANNFQDQKRMIQKSASINIQVMDPLDAADKLTALTEEMGGFVVSSSSTQERYSGDIYLPRVNLTIRVPSERLNETIEFIENLTGDTSKYVSNKRVYGVDITADFVDTSSRLTSLEKTRDKLYEILDSAQNAEEALEVYNRIAEIESDIEVHKGQIKYMQESVALSSVEVQISSVRPAPISTVSKWSIGDVFKNAFETLLDGGKSLIEFLIYFFIVVIPILALAAIPVVLIVFLVRKAVRSRKGKAAKTGTPDKKEDALAEVKKE